MQAEHFAQSCLSSDCSENPYVGLKCEVPDPAVHVNARAEVWLDTSEHRHDPPQVTAMNYVRCPDPDNFHDSNNFNNSSNSDPDDTGKMKRIADYNTDLVYGAYSPKTGDKNQPVKMADTLEFSFTGNVLDDKWPAYKIGRAHAATNGDKKRSAEQPGAGDGSTFGSFTVSGILDSSGIKGEYSFPAHFQTIEACGPIPACCVQHNIIQEHHALVVTVPVYMGGKFVGICHYISYHPLDLSSVESTQISDTMQGVWVNNEQLPAYPHARRLVPGDIITLGGPNVLVGNFPMVDEISPGVTEHFVVHELQNPYTYVYSNSHAAPLVYSVRELGPASLYGTIRVHK